MTLTRRHFLHVAAALLAAPLLPRTAETPRAVSEGMTFTDGQTLHISTPAVPFLGLKRDARYLYTEFWSLDSGPIHVWPGDMATIKKTGRYEGSYTFEARRTGIIVGVAFTILPTDSFFVSPLYHIDEVPDIIEMEDTRT